MTRRILLVALMLGGLCAPAFAGENWIDQFLRRYRPSLQNIQANPAAQDPLPGLIRSGIIPLSIGDLINLTLENNLDIAMNRLNPVSSGFLIETGYRPFEPTLRLGASVSRDTSQSRTQLNGVDSVSQLSHSYTVGYGQTLKYGTDVALDFTLNRSSSNNGFNTFNPSWYGLMRYSVTQPLLNGFGRNINTRSIRVAQNNKTISEVQFERQVIELVTQAQKVYWDLVFTAEDLKVKQDSLNLARKTLSDNEKQVEVGALARIDLIQAETQVATRNEELIVSTFTQDQLQDQIKKLLTSRSDPGLVLARIAPTQTARKPEPADVMRVEDAIRVALENRPELRQANLELRNSDIDIEYSRNQLLPSLGVSATYTQNGVGGTETLRAGFGPTATVQQVIPGGLGDALGELLKFHNRGYSLGFNLEIPLSNRPSQAEYSRATIQKNMGQRNIKALELQIALEVRNAITAVEMNKARIDTAQKTRELSGRQLAAEQRKFELGATVVRFVLEEQRNLEQAQTNEISAMVNYAKSLVDYDRALGLTLKKNSVVIEKALALK